MKIQGDRKRTHSEEIAHPGRKKENIKKARMKKLEIKIEDTKKAINCAQ
jgi:hypothetical protein